VPTALGRTINPPFGVRAKASIAAVISAGLLAGAGTTSTPIGCADHADSALIGVPGGMIRVLQHGHPRHGGHHLLQHLKPFAGKGMLEDGEAGDVAARTREAGHEAVADRIGDHREHDGVVLVSRCSSARIGTPVVTITSARNASNSRAAARIAAASVAAPIQRSSIFKLRPGT
jgi:hypothetical protein